MTEDSDLKRLRGAAALLSDAVEHGASAIERVHLATAARPFGILERIPPTAIVARGVHVAHDAIASSVYATIRAVNHLARVAVTAALDAAEPTEPTEPTAPAAEPPPPTAPAAAPAPPDTQAP
jgi:hypothetical protein